MKLNLKAKLDQLNIVMKNISVDVAQRAYYAIAQLANLTYNKAVELAQGRLRSRRLDYINALHMKEDGGVFVVYLDESANEIEEGQGGRQMLPALAQGPKSKVSKGGWRYTVIPMRKGLSQSVKLDTPSPTGDLAADMKSLIRGKEFKTVKSGTSEVTGKFTTVERLVSDPSIPSHIKNMVRVREYKKQGDKQPISSSYLTFRTASTRQDASKHWVYPATKGAKIWPDLERWADQQMTEIIRQFFGK